MNKADISIIMGSHSDLEQVRPCLDTLKEFGVAYELKVLSAHRQPKRLISYIEKSSEKGSKVFIAAAGGAAALAGVVAAHTILPVIGIPIETKRLKGIDSLLSTVQMPAGVPVACMAIGRSGSKNAAILALQILAIDDRKIASRLTNYKRRLSRGVKK